MLSISFLQNFNEAVYLAKSEDKESASENSYPVVDEHWLENK